MPHCCPIFIGPRFPWGPIYGSSCLSQTNKLSPTPLCRLNWFDSGWWRYKLNTNWNANWAFQGNVAMQVTQAGGKNFNLCKWCYLVAKFATYANGTLWWTILQLMQVTQPGGGICSLCKWCHLVAKFVNNASDAIWWPNLKLREALPYQKRSFF